jgi:hypothetical protein
MHDEFSQSTGPTSDAGTTCGPFLATPGTSGEWISSAAGSHARTQAASAPEKASTEQRAAQSTTCSESFANFDPGTWSWKTAQASLMPGEDSVLWSAAWPDSGSILNGRAYRLPPLVPPTYESGSSWLPTPCATDWKGQSKVGQRRGQLSEAIEMLPAWVPCECCEGFICTIHGEHAHDCKCEEVSAWSMSPYTAARHGQLNPPFVEWLQGFPIGWTDCEGLGTP